MIRGKAFERSGVMLMSLPFILCIASMRLSTNAEGTPMLPTEWDIKEAQRIVGKYIKEQVDGPWLLDLMKSNSGPIKMTDLIKAILRDANEDDKVRKAATILKDTLKSDNLIGSEMDLNTGLIDNWNDLIAKIETENDIICLYRKNSNETTKRDEDWKTFLRTVSPGYTIHFAIDAGRKYIICLKKIELPETIVDEFSTEAETSTTSSTDVLMETTSEAAMIEDEISASSISSVVGDALQDEESSEQFDGAKRCENKERHYSKDYKENNDGGFTNNVDFETDKSDYDFNSNYDFSSIANHDWRQKFGRGIDDHSKSYITEMTSENFAPPAVCRKPILFFVPKKEESSASPQNSLFTSSALPRLIRTEKLRKGNFNYDQPYDKTDVYQPTVSNVIRYRPNISPGTSKNQPYARRTIEIKNNRKPRLEMFRPQSRQIDNFREKSDDEGASKYHIGKRGKNLMEPVWKSNIEHYPSLLAPGSSEDDRRTNRQRNFPDRTLGFSGQLNQNGYDNLLRSSQGLNGESIFPYRTSRPPQPLIVRPKRPWVYHKSPSRFLTIDNEVATEKSVPSSFYNYDQFDDKFIEPLKSAQTAPHFLPCGRFHPRTNYPEENNLRSYAVDPMTLNANYRNSAYRFYPVCSSDKIGTKNSIDNRWNDRSSGFSSSASKPCCDRPMKLKIVINGKLSEPLRVAALPESEQKWQMSGSVDSGMIHDSREAEHDSKVKNRLDVIREMIRPVIGLRMDMRNTSEEESSTANMVDGTSVHGDENNSTMGNQMEGTSARSKIATSKGDAEEKQNSHDKTIPPNFRIAASETISTTMNSAIVM